MNAIRRRRNRAALVVATSVAITGLLAACSTSGAGGNQSGSGSNSGATATLWAVSAGTDQPLLNAAKAFEKAHPGEKVDITFLPNSDAGKQKLTIAMQGNAAPTMLMNTGGSNLEQYVQAGKVLPVDDVMGSKHSDWKSAFQQNAFGAVTVNNKIYGVPLLGSEPIMMFYSKPVYKKLGLSVPTTFDQLLQNAAAIKKAGLAPFALGNSQGWPGLVWEQMLVDRYGGPGVIKKILAGDSSAWKDPAFIKANTMIQRIAKAGYFQTGYSAVDYSTGQPNALLYTNKAGMQMMLNFLYTQMQTQSASYIKNGDLGWFAVPSVSGGLGDPKDAAGNVGQYAVVTKSATAAQKAVAADFLASELPEPTHVKEMLAAGEVPQIASASKFVNDPSVSEFTKFTYSLVAAAPAYQNSWDHALPASVSQTMLTSLENVFTLKWTPQQFSNAMAAAK